MLTQGAYHSVGGKHKHLPRYLAEFCYRFNRRIKLQDMLPRLAYVAVSPSVAQISCQFRVSQ